MTKKQFTILILALAVAAAGAAAFMLYTRQNAPANSPIATDGGSSGANTPDTTAGDHGTNPATSPGGNVSDREIEEADLSKVFAPQGLKQALANAVKGSSAEDLFITYVEVKNHGLYGKAGYRSGPTGFHFVASIEGSSWRIDYAGQDAVPCSLVREYGFSELSIPQCWDDEEQGLQKR